MHSRFSASVIMLLFLAVSAGERVSAAPLVVASFTPTAQSIGASVGTTIAVTFDRAVKRSTVTSRSFWAFGRWSGNALGAFTFSNGDRTVTLTPQLPLSAGENVMVTLSHDLQATDNSPLRSAGYSWQFWTGARAANMVFTQVGQPVSTRNPETPDEPSRAYGGLGADLNRDGYPDVTIVNEDSHDLRVFMNLADGTGRMSSFLRPTFPIGVGGSPSEVTDFNGDGKTDICVSNADSQSVSILLGNGDGTFGAQQEVDMGGTPAASRCWTSTATGTWTSSTRTRVRASWES